VTHLLFTWLAEATSLNFRLTPDRIAVVFATTVGMTVVAGTLAVRRALTADPAEMFR
jgi:ABC-type lipoprotein release transport system permease subunit